MRDNIETAELLFDISEALLALCREQNRQLCALGALNAAEAAALADAEDKMRYLTASPTAEDINKHERRSADGERVHFPEGTRGVHPAH